MVVKVRKKKKEGKRRGNQYSVVFRNLIPTAGDINKVRYEKVVVVLSLARFPGLIPGMPFFCVLYIMTSSQAKTEISPCSLLRPKV